MKKLLLLSMLIALYGTVFGQNRKECKKMKGKHGHYRCHESMMGSENGKCPYQKFVWQGEIDESRIDSLINATELPEDVQTMLKSYKGKEGKMVIVTKSGLAMPEGDSPAKSHSPMKIIIDTEGKNGEQEKEVLIVGGPHHRHHPHLAPEEKALIEELLNSTCVSPEKKEIAEKMIARMEHHEEMQKAHEMKVKKIRITKDNEVIIQNEQGDKTKTMIIEKSNADLNGLREMSVYPNPNDGTFKLEFDPGNTQDPVNIKILDLNGKEVYQETWKPTGEKYSKQLELNSLSSGGYSVVLETPSQKMVKKVIIK